jgi:hypothetical protein
LRCFNKLLFRFLQVLLALPQQHKFPPLLGAELVDALTGLVDFGGSAALQAYFRTRSRWAVLEFLEEARSALEGIERSSPQQLVSQGKAMVGLQFGGPGMKSGEVTFVVQDGGRGADAFRRGVQSGDYVLVSPVGRSAAQPVEMTVERTGSPLVMKLLDRTFLNKVVASYGRANDSSGGSYRVDKLANRVSFARQLEGAFHRVGPNRATFPSVLSENPDQLPELGPRC